MHKNTSKKGFTLVEIMIVVVIIGLLAAMAIPAFQKVRDASRASSMDNDARQLAAAAQQFMLENSETAADITYDSDTGVITGDEVSDYVSAISKNYTSVPATITANTAFTMQSVLGTGTYSAEGQRTAKSW